MIWTLLLLIGLTLLHQEKPSDLGLSVGPSGQLLAGVHPLAQWLGAATSWSPADKRVTITRNGTTVHVWVDRDTMQTNGGAVHLPDRPRIVDGHAVAPLRPIVEAFGGRLEFRAAEGIVVLRSRGE